MSQYAILTDLNRCVGCLACTVACKMLNDVPIGNYWNKVMRIGPTPKQEPNGAGPQTDMYFLPMTCQHCTTPQCVEVCPTQASMKLDNGIVRIDPDLCIGCQMCVGACPYGVRYLNEDKLVVEKCTMCEQRVEEGELPQCVDGCVGLARWFGDLDEDELTDFRGALDKTYGEVAEDFSAENLHRLPNYGNDPAFLYILRDMQWQGEE